MSRGAVAMSEIPVELLMYCMFGGLVQIAAAAAVMPFYLLLGRYLFRRPFTWLIQVYGIFNACLFFWGGVGDLNRFTNTYDKLYHSVDGTVDWYPFIPFGQWVLDSGFGGDASGRLLGNTTLQQLQQIWWVMATCEWVLTFVCTIAIIRSRR